jgi:PKD repeat protein
MKNRPQFLLLFILAITFCVSISCNKERVPLTITANPASPTINTSVRFQSSQDGSGWRFSWDFGDGGSNTTNTSYADHTYLQPGVYNVSLSVSHDSSQLGSCSISITVQ